jgi:phospholipid/cholesterol/gamma-HCH transport system substrate-binding protein
MSQPNRASEVKVGVFVFLALAALAYMSLQVGSGVFMRGATYDLTVEFPNVSGLKIAAPVEIAGIEVGKVKDIALADGRAQVTLQIREQYRVHADVVALIRTRGVLGDKYVELAGGTAAAPSLADGGRIPNAGAGAGMDDLLEKVGRIADDIGLVAKSVAGVLGGPKGEEDLRLTVQSLRDMSVSLNQLVQANMESVNAIVGNMREFTGDLRNLTGNNRKSLQTMVDNFSAASGQLKSSLEAMNRVMARLDSGQGALGQLINDPKMGEDLKATVASLQSVAEKIDSGKGTLGALVNENATGQKLDRALEGLGDYLAKQDQLRTVVDFHAEALTSGDTKTYLDLKLQPSEDKYYLLGIVDDPKGRTKTTDTTTRTKVGGGSWVETTEHKEETVEEGLKFNAQIAKRWSNVALRGGIFESTGGAAVDWYVWDDRVRFFFEAFDFDDHDPAHLKAGARINFLSNFYITGGMDDFASGKDRAAFVGAGLFFTDDDLKFLLGSAPIPKN